VAHTVERPDRLASFLALIDSTTPMDRLHEGTTSELAAMAGDWPMPWAQVTAPVLAVHSPADADVSAEHIDRVRTALPHARILRPRAGGHLVWLGPEGAQVVRATLEHLAAA
jgi:pimeloyl-ACP methyl ester carboxylesterase